MASTAPTRRRDVVLAVPVKAEYVGLLRLALSAVGRLGALTADDVSDLKLAVDEAARRWIPAAPEPGAPSDAWAERPGSRERLSVLYDLTHERLRLELSCRAPEVMTPAEHELSVSILMATADECRAEPGFTELVKYIGRAAVDPVL